MRLLVLFAVVLCSLGSEASVNVLQDTIDISRLQTILQENVKSKDISTLYYTLKGLKLLNAKIPEICNDIKNTKCDKNNVEQVFYLTNAAALSGCQNSLTPDVMKAATQTLDKKDVTIVELYYAVFALKALGKGTIYDKEDGLKNLIQLLKKDDSPANYGYVFQLCEHIGCQDWTTKHAEGVLLAADESDSKALYFEGGLPVTSSLLSTIIRSYKAASKPTPLSEAQRLKFGEYLVSRRGVTSARGATHLLEAALLLADQQPTPISIAVKGKKYITPEADTIEISVTDLLRRPLSGLKADEVVAQSGTRLADDVVVLSKQPLTQKDASTFVLNLSKIKAQYGLYKIAISAGTKSTSVNIAVLGEIQVESVEVGIGDIDGTTSPKLTTVKYPNQLGEVLQADLMQKVTLKFTVKDKFNKPVLVQQAFVHVGDEHEETVFVAEPDNNKAYKVELSVSTVGKQLQRASGTYGVSVFLGDSAVSNAISWRVVDIAFKFGSTATALGDVEPLGGAGHRGALPQIRHVFRSAEARPPRAVSDVFAAASAAPLLLLLLLWFKIGINFKNLPVSLSTLLFHVGLGGSLFVYWLFWVRLNMFEAARYMAPLAALTFLAGHRLLRRLVRDKQH